MVFGNLSLALIHRGAVDPRLSLVAPRGEGRRCAPAHLRGAGDPRAALVLADWPHFLAEVLTDEQKAQLCKMGPALVWWVTAVVCGMLFDGAATRAVLARLLKRAAQAVAPPLENPEVGLTSQSPPLPHPAEVAPLRPLPVGPPLSSPPPAFIARVMMGSSALTMLVALVSVRRASRRVRLQRLERSSSKSSTVSMSSRQVSGSSRQVSGTSQNALSPWQGVATSPRQALSLSRQVSQPVPREDQHSVVPRRAAGRRPGRHATWSGLTRTVTGAADPPRRSKSKDAVPIPDVPLAGGLDGEAPAPLRKGTGSSSNRSRGDGLAGAGNGPRNSTTFARRLEAAHEEPLQVEDSDDTPRDTSVSRSARSGSKGSLESPRGARLDSKKPPWNELPLDCLGDMLSTGEFTRQMTVESAESMDCERGTPRTPGTEGEEDDNNEEDDDEDDEDDNESEESAFSDEFEESEESDEQDDDELDGDQSSEVTASSVTETASSGEEDQGEVARSRRPTALSVAASYEGLNARRRA
uniref:Uncharacterized protein n=1 Tax=Alexandrium monilatum TaxID=311494 RepID=A0A7S4QLW1_9DINO|mmetsp:Transcript_58492/g.174064  ORF Transcript_58492/g.174064 Transcript_58492/m.174064 type:complete len:525 (+) Transcript_58492:84-1658(+)